MARDKLVMMLNQIAAFHRRLPTADATQEIARHVESFWEPRMRQKIYARLDQGDIGLDPAAHAAMLLLREADAGKLPFDPGEGSKLTSPLEA
jgi:formate dehydrogenase subunit delta